MLSKYRTHLRIIMVLDNVRYQHARLLKKWILKKSVLELVYLRLYPPELNRL
ncbi:MAG: hypothetical protein GYB55_15275 [Cytophagales bacterium]|uniref:hypothetical protein n=1 Tax=Cyclobacterium marinum TaxID=104 RepID=UPI003C6D0F3C|nr:hypothetical protein [Cytophagales bacterium]